MDETLFTIISIIAPLILLGVLIWMAIQSSRRRKARGTENSPAGTDVSPVYREDERRRREGTDDL